MKSGLESATLYMFSHPVPVVEAQAMTIREMTDLTGEAGVSIGGARALGFPFPSAGVIVSKSAQWYR